MRILCSLVLMSIPTVLCAQDSLHYDKQTDSIYREFVQETRRAGLVGLHEMHLVIDISDASFRADVENRLRSQGVPFVSRYIEALHQSGSPTLYVDLIKLNVGTNVYRATVELKEEVNPVRNGAQRVHFAVTWSTERFVQDNASQRHARAALLDAVDEFVKAYLAANRKR